MKLSMWMIANRLSSFDMDVAIKDDAQVCLYSARLAHATNCIYIHKGKDGVVCEHEGSKITLYNMDVTQAFEIIQSVFDFYEDWSERVNDSINRKDFQAVIDYSYTIFQNPMILLDGNCKLLGMSSNYAASDMDSEWQYVAKYGYSSLRAVQTIKHACCNIDFEKHGKQMFAFKGDSHLALSGISYCLYYNDAMCGRLNVFEKDRPLNQGDFQVIEKIAQRLEPVLGLSYTGGLGANNNTFYSLLFNKPFSKSDLDLQMEYCEWQIEDCYQLAALELSDYYYENNNRALTLLIQLLQSTINDCVIVRHRPYVLLLANRRLSEDAAFRGFMDTLTREHSINIGFSLYCSNILNAGFLLSQSCAAIRYGKAYAPEDFVYHFEAYAVEFMLNGATFSDCIASCHPAIVTLHNAKSEKDDEMFDTLKYYLDFERSVSKTAAALFTHRNTVLYRIKKIQELIPEDLDDPKIRYYLRASINVLELKDKIAG